MPEVERPRRSYASAVIGCWCPRCREGKLFAHRISLRLGRNMEMHEHCPVCGQPTDIEVGFYYGTGYVSYLLGIGITVLSFLAWLLLVGFSFKDSRFLTWMVFNSFLLLGSQPWLMRFSRSLWLSFFVPYEPDWEHSLPTKLERTNNEQKNNW